MEALETSLISCCRCKDRLGSQEECKRQGPKKLGQNLGARVDLSWENSRTRHRGQWRVGELAGLDRQRQGKNSQENLVESQMFALGRQFLTSFQLGWDQTRGSASLGLAGASRGGAAPGSSGCAGGNYRQAPGSGYTLGSDPGPLPGPINHELSGSRLGVQGVLFLARFSVWVLSCDFGFAIAPDCCHSVQLPSRVRLFATPWTIAHQASLSLTISWSLPKFTATESWCHPTISSSVVPFPSCPQSFPATGSFPMSHFFTSGGQIIGASASASVLPMNAQGCFPLGVTGLVSLQSKGLSRVFSWLAPNLILCV